MGEAPALRNAAWINGETISTALPFPRSGNGLASAALVCATRFNRIVEGKRTILT